MTAVLSIDIDWYAKAAKACAAFVKETLCASNEVAAHAGVPKVGMT